MDMSGSSSATGQTSMMTPYLHFTGGDHLFFKSLTPTSSGAIAGACIVLALLAILERILSAARGTMEAHWKQRVFAMTVARFSSLSASPDECHDTKEAEISDIPSDSPTAPLAPVLSSGSRRTRIIAPFIAAHDVPRGALYALQVLLAYVLMLAVMTYQAAYIISIVAGLGLGEMFFGRFAIVH
ncbi:copper transporter [Vararia minispora EC-137]|uniref:Copper transporter n=1 Tax=Vararia minispora EC-137 TaxID=1314806 RepID=A0ACB8QTY7_9AGAM|nr:copper transporter [Vararia minispora EC-137]